MEEKTRSTVKVECASCKQVLPEDIADETCPKCVAPLNLKRSVSIEVASLPPIFGSTIE